MVVRLRCCCCQLTYLHRKIAPCHASMLSCLCNGIAKSHHGGPAPGSRRQCHCRPAARGPEPQSRGRAASSMPSSCWPAHASSCPARRGMFSPRLGVNRIGQLQEKMRAEISKLHHLHALGHLDALTGDIEPMMECISNTGLARSRK